MWIKDPNNEVWHAVRAPMPGPIPGTRGVTCCKKLVTGFVEENPGVENQCSVCLAQYEETLEPPPGVAVKE